MSIVLKSTKDVQAYVNSLWTVRDVQDYFGKSAMTIYWWQQKRGLPALQFMGDQRNTLRFDPNEVKAWAALNKVAPATPTLARESLLVA